MWKRVLAALTIAITAFLPMTKTVEAGNAALLDCHQNSGNGYWTIQLQTASPDDPPYWYQFLFLQEGGSFSTGEWQHTNLYWGDSEAAWWWNPADGRLGQFPNGFTNVFDFQSNTGTVTVWERQWSYVDGQWAQRHQTLLGICQIYQYVPSPIYPGGYGFWPSTSSTQFIW